MMAKKSKEPTCSFCGGKSDEVEKLFDSGNGPMICDECVMNCLNIMVYGETFEIDLGESEEDIDEGVQDASIPEPGC